MNIKRALTRKFGPLPAWAWFTIALGVIYYYRKYKAGTGTVSGTGTGSIGPAPATPQPQTTLQPGESVYDPNTGALTTAPGGGGSGTTSADALTAAMNNLADAIGSGMPPQQVVITDPSIAPAGPTNTSPGIAPGVKNKPPHLIGRGAVRAPSGHNRPAGKKGFTIKGLGRGFWEYVPKRTPKSKGQHAATGKTSKHVSTGSRSVSRSNTVARTKAGGRTGRNLRGSLGSRPRQPTSTASVRLHQHAKTPAVHAVVQQRRQAATPAPSRRQVPAPAPRPSAPAPRTQRAPTGAPARPVVRKRKK